MSSSSLSRLAPSSDSHEELLSSAQERVDALCTSEQARLILTGLRGNHCARRALALAASFEPSGRIPKMAMGRLLALPKNRFLALYESLQLCGALVPLPLNEESWRALGEQADVHNALSVESVFSIWRQSYGDILNPALTLLMREEMDSA